MKKTLYITCILAAASFSCTKEEKSLDMTDSTRITFCGSTVPRTKISVGEKDGNTYPLLWGTGDIIKIYSKNSVTSVGDEGETISGNVPGETAELYDGDSGKSSGVFQATNDFSVDSDESIVILYPGTNMTYSDGKAAGSVSMMQEQVAAHSSIHIGNNAFAYAETTLKTGQTEDVEFTLTQKTAFVKLVLSTSEYSGLKLSGACLYSPGSELSGDISCDISSGSLTVTNTSEKVGAEFKTPVSFSETQEVYFTALPCDLTGKETYIVVTMTDGTETVTIPAKISGGVLKESCLSVITVSGISSSMNQNKWYDPVETRDLVDGWAYGPQNTYYIESKASGEGETSMKIDVKARGDFSKVKEPKYYGLLTASSEMSTRKFIHLPNNIAAYEEKPTNTINSDWTIDIYAYDQKQTGRWAVVAIYDKDYNVLWSYMICKYLPGDEIGDVTYTSDIVLMDRNLGELRSNEAAEAAGKFEGSSAFFQWGRKDPFMWSNSGITHYNQSLAPADSDISTAIEHPSMIYGYQSGTDGDWKFKDHRSDLWGGVNNTLEWYDADGTGHKTIYDPCPKGYRVPDAKVFAEVTKSAEIWEVNLSNSYQPEVNIKSDSPFAANNQATLAYPLSGGKYDYWPYAGAHWGSNGSWGNRTSSNSRHGCLYWANSVDPAALLQAVVLEYCYFSAAYVQGETHFANKAQCFAVRCQKDTENR